MKHLAVMTKSLPVALVLGTWFIDAHVDNISGKRKMVELNDLSQIPVVSRVFSKLPLRTTCYVIVTLNTVAYLPVKSTFIGLGVIMPTRNNAHGWLANGFVNLQPTDSESPSYLQFSNFGYEPLTIQKGMVIGNIQPPSTIALAANSEKAPDEDSWKDKIYTSHLEENESVKLFLRFDAVRLPLEWGVGPNIRSQAQYRHRRFSSCLSNAV